MELVDVSAAVLSYMNMFVQDFQRTGENGRILLKLLSISSLNDYKVGGEDYNLIVSRMKEIISSVPSLERSRTLKATGKAGVYGSLYSDPNEPGAVYKVIELPADEVRQFTFILSFLKETFIQHLISSDPDLGKHAPKVLGIYKNTPTGIPSSLTIKMEKSNITLQSRIQKKEPVVRLDYLRPILIDIIRLLMKLQDKYHFTHRDFKTNNIMYKENVLQIIDYGMACIHFKAFGMDYNIINNTYHTSRSKCMIEQDIALLMVNLQLMFGTYFDEPMKAFMSSIGMPNFMNILNKLKTQKNTAAGLLGAKVRLFNIAYNHNNVLYKRSNVGPNFKPEFVLSKLGQIVGTAIQPRISQVAATRKNLTNMKRNIFAPAPSRQTFKVATRIAPPPIAQTQVPIVAKAPIEQTETQVPIAQTQAPIAAKALNNAKNRLAQKEFLVGTVSSPTHYALMPLRAIQA
jgi:serine/threonine protein kinase